MRTMAHYRLSITNEKRLAQAIAMHRAHRMKIPIKICGEWVAVTTVKLESDPINANTTNAYNVFIPPRTLLTATITPYHTRRTP